MESKLKTLREEIGYSQKALAKELGITQQAYGSLEQGKTGPSHKTWLKLRRLFSGKYIEDMCDECPIRFMQTLADMPDAEFDRIHETFKNIRALKRHGYLADGTIELFMITEIKKHEGGMTY